jgi:predicted phage-related endonuclease
VVEVGDQLPKDPRLVRIGDPVMTMLDDRLGEDSPPRQVVQRHLARKFASVDIDRTVLWGRSDLIRDSQYAVESMLPSHV